MATLRRHVLHGVKTIATCKSKVNPSTRYALAFYIWYMLLPDLQFDNFQGLYIMEMHLDRGGSSSICL
jgi:hypothetical protein